MLLLVASSPTAASAQAEIQPGHRVPELVTLRHVTGLGPVTFSNGDAGLNRLRLFNPTDEDAVALVRGMRIAVPAGQIVESDAFTGDVTVRSAAELLVNSRVSDVSLEDAPNATHDAQFASSDLRHPGIAPLAITTQTCGSTTLVTTASVACQNGTSAAMVEAINGATYEWTAVNATILNGQGTNLVTLAFGSVSNASISVVVRTPDGCVLNGSATITVRDPFQIASLTITPSNPRIGDTVTVSWTYTTSETPKTQTLTLTAPDGTSTVVKVPLADRSYSFVANATGTWNASFLGSLVGGRRRSVRFGATALAPPSPCYQDTASRSFTVSPQCVAQTGSISISPSSLQQGSTAQISTTASGSWTLSSSRGNGLSQTSGTGNANVTYTGSNVGSDTVTLRLLGGACGDVLKNATAMVTCPAPAGSISASPSTVNQGGSSTLTITTSGSWTLSSSLNNGLSRTSGTGNTTVTYTATNSGNDTLTLGVTNSCGSTANRQVSITVNTVCTKPVVSVSVSPGTINFGGQATVTVNCTGCTSTPSVTSSMGDPIIFQSASAGTYRYTYSSQAGPNPNPGATITAIGQNACGSSAPATTKLIINP